MFIRPAILFLLASAALSTRAAAPSTISPDAGWQQVDQKEGVTIYSRGRVGSALKEFKGVGIIPAPSPAVERVLSSVADYPNFMPYVSEARVISRSGNSVVTYQRLAFPIVSDRDYAVRVEHSSEATPEGTVFRNTWQTNNEAAPPKARGVVRVYNNEGSWLLEPAGPNATRATYRIFTDSGGLPAFLANRASQTAIPKLFVAIRKQAQLPRYSVPAASPAALP